MQWPVSQSVEIVVQARQRAAQGVQFIRGQPLRNGAHQAGVKGLVMGQHGLCGPGEGRPGRYRDCWSGETVTRRLSVLWRVRTK